MLRTWQIRKAYEREIWHPRQYYIIGKHIFHFRWWWRFKSDEEWCCRFSQINHNHRLSSLLQTEIYGSFKWSIDLPFLSFREHYFASAAWVSQTEVSVVWMNRAQNLSVVTLCKSPMWYCQEVRWEIKLLMSSFFAWKKLQCKNRNEPLSVWHICYFRRIKRAATVEDGLMN